MRVAPLPGTLLSLFSQIPDPRRGQGQMYPQAPILLFTVLAMLAGAVSYRQVHAFIRIHLVRLNGVFGVSVRKAPAYSTVRFILRGLDGAEVERVFRQHAAGLPTPPAQEPDDAMPDDVMPACVAIDGKTLRGSFDAFNDRKAAHLLSAFASDGQIILGHLAIDEKSNEIPAAQDLIATLGLTGRMFTLDAMHAQKNLRRSPGHG
ncbi:ISAs1 family transposase [Mesorhizobium huakuii]|uniref:ISAs1 family transposase n=2 Tax=Mesorhizobium huakuii TaxID=28104 RepID=A0A7G6T6D5_9HYPH|nr:ISAs1 family transposase [Mesorhizobium huakuii]QND55338.1 ISAs1 family transposase [Mesorhizobium huakuii]QND57343.1 ISAs1 family transposase [Mesorhizobium huakuii]QND58910.1 ISAs1 family transposase [Mesorhizobium huakuii]QND59304.1 ISAs1 family transposase [Mesorhizobium huakuii]QND61749.1 ISAs1 family transposase [Mesorhizobium huakuii]